MPYTQDGQWLTVYQDAPEAAAALAASFTPEQTLLLFEQLDSFDLSCYYRLEHDINRFVLAVLTCPHLTEPRLAKLAEFVWENHPLFREAVQAILLHPTCSERVVAELLYPDNNAEASRLATVFGWLYPAAQQLNNPGADVIQTWSRAKLRVEFDAALQLAQQLRERLHHDSPQACSVVATVGLTWAGTVDELLEAARGITA